MMPRTFLIRFDDVCPTMNWEIWAGVERVLEENEIKPLIAVVPDNHHESLVAGPPRRDFWAEVARWSEIGWSIGMHGYQHVALTQEGGILGINGWSEFVGLSAAEQERRLDAALQLFSSNGLSPDVWVAPGHSFDETTLSLLRARGFSIVSDGLTPLPFEDRHGLQWIPQQLWRFRPVPFGVWTVAFHTNRWTEKDVRGLRAAVRRYRPWISDLQTVAARYEGRRATFLDRAFAAGYRQAVVRRRSSRSGNRSERLPHAAAGSE